MGVSNRGGWQSPDDINTRPGFEALIRLVEETMVEIKEFLTIDDDVTFRVGTAWINF